MPADHLWAKTPEAVVTDSSLTRTAHKLYGLLDLRAGRRGYWWGSQEEIARALGVSTRTVRTATRQLLDRGYIATMRTVEHRTQIKYFVLARRDPDRRETSAPSGEKLPVRPEGSFRSTRARDPDLPEIHRSQPQKAATEGGGIRSAWCPEHSVEGRESRYRQGEYYHPLPGGGRCVFAIGPPELDPYAQVVRRH